MAFISLLLLIVVVIVLPIVGNGDAFTVSVDSLSSYFSGAVSSITGLSGLNVLFFTFILGASIMVLSVSKDKISFALSAAGSLGCGAYLIYSIANIVQTLMRAIEKASDHYSGVFTCELTGSTIAYIIFCGHMALWIIVLLVIKSISVFLKAKKA